MTKYALGLNLFAFLANSFAAWLYFGRGFGSRTLASLNAAMVPLNLAMFVWLA